MDKLILFLLIIVLILCFKNINVMVKKSDEGVMKVIIILIIIGLIFMCKGDLVERLENCEHESCKGNTLCWTGEACGAQTEKECNATDGFYYCSEQGDKPGDDKPGGDNKPGDDRPGGDKPGGDNKPNENDILVSNNETFIKGICYTMPTMYVNGTIVRDNIKTDVAADELWSKARSRGDLDILKKSGVTHLRVYDWDLNADHTIFLEDLESKELNLMLSISDYFIKNLNVLENSLDNLLKEITNNGKYRECIHSIIIGNEPDLQGEEGNYTNSMEAVKKLLNHENTNNITNKDDIKLSIPVSFGNFSDMGPGVKQIDDIIRIIKEKNINILNRFVPSIQTKNPSTDIEDLFYKKLTPEAKRYIDRMGFYITEWSLPSPLDGAPNRPGPKQANLDVNDTRLLMNMKSLKGIFGFQYLNPVDKTGVEKEFGFTRFNNCKEVNNCPSPSETICDYNGSMVALSEAYGGKDPGIPFCQN